MSLPHDAPIDVWLDRLYRCTRGGAPRDPRRMAALLGRLDLHAPSPLVHVVGTNGKGSVAARVDAGLRAAGRRPLRFLSPHVERFHERIAVGGDEIRDDEIRAFLARAWHDEPSPPAAFFELTLAMALAVAASRRADAAVVEAGVGAARDATLALGDADVVVVTVIAEDHLEHLGPTVLDVARDKGAAIRSGRPVVTGADGPPLDELRRIAAERGASLHALTDGGPTFAWPAALPRPTAGSVDERSARLAFASLRALDLHGERLEQALRSAAADPGLPARRERFLLAGDRTVWLDGAHNPAAAEALARDLPAGAHVLLGVAARKDTVRIRAAFGGAARVTLTTLGDGGRPWPEDDAGHVIERPEDALEAALAAVPAGGTLLITGSFHLAGRLRPVLRQRVGGSYSGYDPRP